MKSWFIVGMVIVSLMIIRGTGGDDVENVIIRGTGGDDVQEVIIRGTGGDDVQEVIIRGTGGDAEQEFSAVVPLDDFQGPPIVCRVLIPDGDNPPVKRLLVGRAVVCGGHYEDRFVWPNGDITTFIPPYGNAGV